MWYLYAIAITKGKLAALGPIIRNLLNVQVKYVEILQVLLPLQIL